MSVMTAAQFNRAPSLAKRQVLSSDEPLLVTDRDRPSIVVMKYDAYLRMTQPNLDVNVAQWLEMDTDIDFDPPSLGLGLQEVDL